MGIFTFQRPQLQPIETVQKQLAVPPTLFTGPIDRHHDPRELLPESQNIEPLTVVTFIFRGDFQYRFVEDSVREGVVADRELDTLAGCVRAEQEAGEAREHAGARSHVCSSNDTSAAATGYKHRRRT